MRVDIYTAGPPKRKLGSMRIDNGRVLIDRGLEHMEPHRLYVIDPETRQRLFPRDGERWLRAFPRALLGSRSWAEVVES